MTTLKETLIDELEIIPDELLQELLDFLRLTKVRQSETHPDSTTIDPQSALGARPLQFPFRPASGHSLLRHAGKWADNDLEACLQQVYDTRSEAEFSLDETI